MLRLGALFLLGALLFPSRSWGQNSLTFTGGFWETDDSFRLRIEFGEKVATLHWDGYPDPYYAFGRETENPPPPPQERISFQVELDDDETGLLRSVWMRFHHCDPGPDDSIGTGLLTRVTVMRDGESRSFHYFAPPEFDYLAKEGQALPVELQSRLTPKGIDAEGRDGFIRVLKSLDRNLRNYEKALTALEESFTGKVPPDWEQIWEWVRRDETLREPEWLPEEERAPANLQATLPALLTTYVVERFPEKPTILYIDTMGKASALRWGALYLRGPQLLRDPNGRWCTLPVELKLLLEDFIELTPTTQGPYEGQEPHPVFDLFDLSPAEQARLEFLARSDLDAFLFGFEPSEDRAPPHFEKILCLGFDEENGYAAMQTLSQNEAYISELSKTAEDSWSHVRTTTYDQWTNEWDADDKRPGLFEPVE